MYLLTKWISKNTDIKVLMTGEVSDELIGYKYKLYKNLNIFLILFEFLYDFTILYL